MASSMARRLALIVAAAAAAMVVAVPAQARTHLHADRPRLGPRHRPVPVRRARLCPARLGLRRDPGPLLHGHHPVGRSRTRCRCASSSRAAGRPTRSRARRRSRSSTRAAARRRRFQPGSYRVERGTSGRLRVVDAATSARVVKHLTGPVRLGALAGASSRQHRRHRLGARPLARRAAGHRARARRSCWSTSCRSSTTCAASCRARCRRRGRLPALRAQAVAARSYAVATRHPSSLFDAYADTRSQVYGPIEHEAAGLDSRRRRHRAPGAVVLGYASPSGSSRRRRGDDLLRAGGLGQRRRAVPRARPRPLRRRRRGEPEPHLDAAGLHAERAGAGARASAARCARST